MDMKNNIDNYLDELSCRRIDISNGIISLGKLGTLLHPLQLLSYKNKIRKLDKIENGISKLIEKNDSDKIEEYIENNPVTSYHLGKRL